MESSRLGGSMKWKSHFPRHRTHGEEATTVRSPMPYRASANSKSGIIYIANRPSFGIDLRWIRTLAEAKEVIIDLINLGINRSEYEISQPLLNMEEVF